MCHLASSLLLRLCFIYFFRFGMWETVPDPVSFVFHLFVIPPIILEIISASIRKKMSSFSVDASLQRFA